METDIVTFFAEHANVASVSELAAILDESEGRIRAWARENPESVRRIGSTFCFSPESAEQMLADFEEQDVDEDEGFDEDEDDVAAAGGDDGDPEDDDSDEPDEDEDEEDEDEE